MEQQELKDIPKTSREIERQKGPVPASAIFIALGLFAVLMLYYGPVWWDAIFGNNGGQ